MSERFEKLLKYDGFYQDGCPLVMLAGAILLDNDTHQIIVQLKLQNVGSQTIRAVFLSLYCSNIAGDAVKGVSDFQYLDLEEKTLAVFGAQTPIILPDASTRSISVAVEKIVFTNGKMWINGAGNSMQPLPPRRYLADAVGKELALQYTRDVAVGTPTPYVPDVVACLKRCACGAIYYNSFSRCPHCSTTIEHCEECANECLLSDHLKIYLHEKAEQEARHKKRLIRITAICSATIVCTVLIVAFAIQIAIPYFHYTNAEKLLQAGDYNAAIANFSEMLDYKDSTSKLLESYYRKAESLVVAGKYDEAISAYQAADGYGNTKDSIREVYYRKGLNLSESKKFDDAIIAFQCADGYLDSEDQILKANYGYAELLASDGRYFKAAIQFQRIAGYNDSIAQLQTLLSFAPTIISTAGADTIAIEKNGNIEIASDNEYGQSMATRWQGITAVSTGLFHSVALKSDGTVVAIGRNAFGECDVESWTSIVQISVSDSHTVGLRSDGTVVAAGLNSSGQCEVDDWRDIVSIKAGESTTIGLRADGIVIAVGDNDHGECEVGNWADIVAISAGYRTIGLRRDGTVVATDGLMSNKNDIASWTDIIAIASGSFHTVGLKSDGTVVAVGDGAEECAVDNWEDIIYISAGGNFTIGVKTDGSVISTATYAPFQNDIANWILW